MQGSPLTMFYTAIVNDCRLLSRRFFRFGSTYFVNIRCRQIDRVRAHVRRRSAGVRGWGSFQPPHIIPTRHHAIAVGELDQTRVHPTPRQHAAGLPEAFGKTGSHAPVVVHAMPCERNRYSVKSSTNSRRTITLLS